MMGVYQITLNGKIYVGSSSHIQDRWHHHLGKLRQGTHCNPHLQNAFNKYGSEDIMFSILETLENRNELIALEQKYIDDLKPEYNIRLIADSNVGIKHGPPSEETRQKIRVANTGRNNSESTRAKLSAANKGKTLSVETKLKIGKSNTGRIFTTETRLRISLANTGRVRTEEMNKKMRARNISEESKQKMRESHLGVPKGPMSELHKQKISQAQKCRKIRIA